MNSETVYTYDMLTVGMTSELKRELLDTHIDAFAQVSGDHNPLHLDPDYARAAGFENRIAHGSLLASWISAALAEHMPGRGTVYLRQTLEFRKPAMPGDQLSIHLTVLEKKRRGRVVFDTRITEDTRGELLRGNAEVIAPV
ncbi:MAG: MaoC family dehydratase [Congregibacter sp.]